MGNERQEQALKRLAALAGTAELHAADLLGSPVAGIDDLDRALDASRGTDDPTAVVTCYGAWLGERLRLDFGAEWIGLHEAAAPRLVVHHRMISPMDAVRRRLDADSAPSLAAVLETVRAWHPGRGTDVAETNRRAWDGLAASERFTAPSAPPPSVDEAREALDPWLIAEGVEGRRILCLAAGGGRHGPLLAAAGAGEVVVLDLSPKQLEHDARAAERHGWRVKTVEGAMDDLRNVGDAPFDIVIQPVSSSYVTDVGAVYREVARVLRPGGLYVSQHKQPAMLQRDGDLAYVEGAPLPPEKGGHREAGCVEFLHTLDGLLGSLCRAGFVIEDVVEPPLGDGLAPEGTFEHRAARTPPYIKVKARRREL